MFLLGDGKLLGRLSFIPKVSSAEELVEIFQLKLCTKDVEFHLNSAFHLKMTAFHSVSIFVVIEDGVLKKKCKRSSSWKLKYSGFEVLQCCLR